MKANEVNSEMIGKRCKCTCSGLMVTGVIEEIKTEEPTVEVRVRYDEPHIWGNHTYETEWKFAREIDKRFARNYKNWGAVNLKEWIDSYESSRFTQIDERTAIITSEYNMGHIEEWLRNGILSASITKII